MIATPWCGAQGCANLGIMPETNAEPKPPQNESMPPAISSWKSPDTYFHLVSVVISALVLSEVFVPGSTAAKVVSCIALALQGLGYNAARMRRVTAGPQAGFFRLDVACGILFVGALLTGATMTACKAGKGAARAGASTVVDCASKSALEHTKEYGSTVEMILASATGQDGKLDGNAVAEATKGFAAETGWCVVENVLAKALAAAGLGSGAPQSSPLQLDAEDAKRALGAIREARYGGRQFKPAPAGQ